MTVLAPVAVALAVAAWVSGPAAALGVGLGIASGVTVAVTTVGWDVRALAALVIMASGAAGLVCAGHPWAAGAAAAVAGLAQGPFNARASGAVVMAPVLVAMGTTVEVGVSAWSFAWWLFVGVAVIVVIARLAGVGLAPRGVPLHVAWRHALAMGVSGGISVGAVEALDVDHGYWMVLVLAMVLRPVRGETARLARDRTLGTLLGALASVVLVLTVPTSLSLALAGVGGLFMVAWALANDYTRMTFFGTPAIILLSSSGVVGATVTVATSRFLLTLLGAVVAASVAVVLARWEDIRPRDGNGVPPSSGGDDLAVDDPDTDLR